MLVEVDSDQFHMAGLLVAEQVRVRHAHRHRREARVAPVTAAEHDGGHLGRGHGGGPGAAERAPAPPFTFVEEVTLGTSPKFKVRAYTRCKRCGRPRGSPVVVDMASA